MTNFENYCMTPVKKATPNVDVNQNESSITITANIDGTFLTNQITKEATEIIVKDFEQAAKDLILKNHYYNTRYSSNVYRDSSQYDLKDWVQDMIKEAIESNKDLIIEMAAAKLADSMRRSKPVREKFCDLLEQELKEAEGND